MPRWLDDIIMTIAHSYFSTTHPLRLITARLHPGGRKQGRATHR